MVKWEVRQVYFLRANLQKYYALGINYNYLEMIGGLMINGKIESL